MVSLKVHFSAIPHLHSCTVLAVAASAVFHLGGAARATEISEYFNDYGTTDRPLLGLDGGSGWNSPWSGNALNFVAGTQADYAGPGYSGAGNQSGPDDGSAGGTGTGTIAYRTFAPLTGTIWISLTIQQFDLGRDVLFWLDKNDANGILTSPRNFVALRGSTGIDDANTTKVPEAVLAYSGDDGSNNQQFAINTPHLMLMRIDMNFSGALDRISLWVDPDLSNGESGLGLTPSADNGPLYVKGSSDAYGTDFEGIGISTTSSNNVVDAIRISDEANGFTYVTTAVPEPGAAALMVLGGALLSQWRRRKAG